MEGMALAKMISDNQPTATNRLRVNSDDVLTSEGSNVFVGSFHDVLSGSCVRRTYLHAWFGKCSGHSLDPCDFVRKNFWTVWAASAIEERFVDRGAGVGYGTTRLTRADTSGAPYDSALANSDLQRFVRRAASFTSRRHS